MWDKEDLADIYNSVKYVFDFNKVSTSRVKYK